MRSKKFITYSFFYLLHSFFKTYPCSFTNFYQSTGIVAGMSSLLVGIFVSLLVGIFLLFYWDSG